MRWYGAIQCSHYGTVANANEMHCADHARGCVHASHSVLTRSTRRRTHLDVRRNSQSPDLRHVNHEGLQNPCQNAAEHAFEHGGCGDSCHELTAEPKEAAITAFGVRSSSISCVRTGTRRGDVDARIRSPARGGRAPAHGRGARVKPGQMRLQPRAAWPRLARLAKTLAAVMVTPAASSAARDHHRARSAARGPAAHTDQRRRSRS